MCVANQLRLSSCVHSRRVWAVCGSQSLFMTEINILPLPLPEPYIWYKKTILSVEKWAPISSRHNYATKPVPIDAA